MNVFLIEYDFEKILKPQAAYWTCNDDVPQLVVVAQQGTAAAQSHFLR